MPDKGRSVSRWSECLSRGESVPEVGSVPEGGSVPEEDFQLSLLLGGKHQPSHCNCKRHFSIKSLILALE